MKPLQDIRHDISSAIWPVAALALALACAAPARAHIVLDEPSVTAGAGYKAVLRISHGCEGSATHTLRVHIPAGFRGTKPMPKPGWTLATRRAPLAEPYESHGRRIDDDVVEVSWTAATREAWLADAHYDEFVLRGQAPAQAGALWFRVEQLCERGRWDWAELPREGTSTRGLRAPAVLLQVRPAEPAPPEHRH